MNLSGALLTPLLLYHSLTAKPINTNALKSADFAEKAIAKK